MGQPAADAGAEKVEHWGEMISQADEFSAAMKAFLAHAAAEEEARYGWPALVVGGWEFSFGFAMTVAALFATTVYYCTVHSPAIRKQEKMQLLMQHAAASTVAKQLAKQASQAKSARPPAGLKLLTQNVWCHYPASFNPLRQMPSTPPHEDDQPADPMVGFQLSNKAMPGYLCRKRLRLLAQHVLAGQYDVICIQELFIWKAWPIGAGRGNFDYFARMLSAAGKDMSKTLSRIAADCVCARFTIRSCARLDTESKKHLSAGLPHHTDPLASLRKSRWVGQNSGVAIFVSSNKCSHRLYLRSEQQQLHFAAPCARMSCHRDAQRAGSTAEPPPVCRRGGGGSRLHRDRRAGQHQGLRGGWLIVAIPMENPYSSWDLCLSSRLVTARLLR